MRFRFLLSLTGLFALLSYFSYFDGMLLHIADDPGIGWHLENGKRSSTLREIPYVDPFLAEALTPNPYVAVGQARPWVSDQWLSDIILYQVYSLGGWPALYAVILGLYLVSYFGIAADSLRRPAQGFVVVLLGIVCAFKLGQVHLIIRPVVFSIALFAWVIRRSARLEGGEIFGWGELRRELLILPPLFVLWANLHPAFVYGVLVIALLVLCLGVRDVRSLPQLVILLLVCGCATLLNPYGPELHESILALGSSSSLRSVMTEWSPIDITSPEGFLLLVLLIAPLSMLVVSRETRMQISGFQVVTALVFFAQALWAVRVAPFASLACLPLWASCFGSIRVLPRYPAAALSDRWISYLAHRESTLVAPGLVSAIVISLVGGMVITYLPERVLPPALGSRYERVLGEMFSQIPSRSTGGVILASSDWGGAITHTLAGEYRPVLDDRTVLVGDALYRAYRASLRERATFDELVAIFGVTHVIIPVGSVTEASLRTDGRWKLEFSSSEVTLFSSDRRSVTRQP